MNAKTKNLSGGNTSMEATQTFTAGGEHHLAVVVSTATFEALLEAGLLECRFGKFLYKGVGPVVQTEPA
jgi:hypothetical protein